MLQKLKRRKTKKIYVGNVAIGGDAPISVQSMTNTKTTDIESTVAQIIDLQKNGADLVRVSTPDSASVDAFAEIRKKVNIPLIADIHFDYSIAIKVANAGADCLRINPGNIGSEKKISEVISCAKDLNIPIRVGVNAGSLEKELLRKYHEPNAAALVESAMGHIAILEKHNFENYKLSVKASDIDMAVEAYQLLADKTQQPLHLGITESGSLRSGTVRSSIGIGMLLYQGIGDTIRVSLAANPIEEIKAGFDILKSLRLRSRGVNLIACPSCSRANFDVIATVNELESRLEDIVEPIDVAVIGCYVNGPGESKEVDIGITGASKNNLVYQDGKPFKKLNNEELISGLETMIREKVAAKKC